MCECSAHAVDGGEARPVTARSQHEQLWLLGHDGRRHQLLVGMAGGEVVAQPCEQLADLAGKLGRGIGDHPPAQHVRGQRVRSRGPAKRQVNPARVHRE